MLHFTKYAEEKFDLLNQHQVFITKEQVEDAVCAPDTVTKNGKYAWYRKDAVRVVCRAKNGATEVVTFYPIKG